MFSQKFNGYMEFREKNVNFIPSTGVKMGNYYFRMRMSNKNIILSHPDKPRPGENQILIELNENNRFEFAMKAFMQVHREYTRIDKEMDRLIAQVPGYICDCTWDKCIASRVDKNK